MELTWTLSVVGAVPSTFCKATDGDQIHLEKIKVWICVNNSFQAQNNK